MTPDKHQKTGNLAAFTLVLVTVLLLIRMDPIYYAAQFIPVRHADVPSMALVHSGNALHGTLRCQRASNERIEVLAVPQIKFTGVPFTAFFAGMLPAETILGPFNRSAGIILSTTRRVAALRNLRL